MKPLLIALVFVIATSTSFGQAHDSTKQKPDKLPLWTIPIPGGSYFYQKKYIQGALFATIELGGLYLGEKYKTQLEQGSSSPYYNYPQNIAIQTFRLEKLANFKNHLEQVKYRNPDFRYHNISEKDLYLAAFKKENIHTPITGAMILIAGAALVVNTQIQETGLKQVSDFYFLNQYMPRNQALAIFCPIGFAQGWGAGVTEEYIYRNWLMPLLDHKLGQRNGLILSSVAFGASHISNFNLREKDQRLLALAQVAGTTLGGLVYGLDIQRRNYNIGPSVAAHVWFDAILMVGSFLINPEMNYLGVNMKFNID